MYMLLCYDFVLQITSAQQQSLFKYFKQLKLREKVYALCIGIKYLHGYTVQGKPWLHGKYNDVLYLIPGKTANK